MWKTKVILVPMHHALETYREVEVIIREFLTSLDEGEWSA
jgi:hypothetical protein